MKQVAIEREALARQLEQLLAKLTSYDKTMLLRDLPAELQKTVRSLRLIGPITSSGIEKVYNIANRVDFAIFGLRNPVFSYDNGIFRRNTEGATNKILPIQPKPTQLAKPPVSLSPPKQTTLQPKQEMDFGPFDPRKS